MTDNEKRVELDIIYKNLNAAEEYSVEGNIYEAIGEMTQAMSRLMEIMELEDNLPPRRES